MPLLTSGNTLVVSIKTKHPIQDSHSDMGIRATHLPSGVSVDAIESLSAVQNYHVAHERLAALVGAMIRWAS